MIEVLLENQRPDDFFLTSFEFFSVHMSYYDWASIFRHVHRLSTFGISSLTTGLIWSKFHMNDHKEVLAEDCSKIWGPSRSLVAVAAKTHKFKNNLLVKKAVFRL